MNAYFPKKKEYDESRMTSLWLGFNDGSFRVLIKD